MILFLSFAALSRVPSSDVKILATAPAFGIIIDAAVVPGMLAPGQVALLGDLVAAWAFRRPRAGIGPKALWPQRIRMVTRCRSSSIDRDMVT